MKTIKDIIDHYKPVLETNIDKIDEESLKKISSLFCLAGLDKVSRPKIIAVSNEIKKSYTDPVYQLEVIGSLVTLVSDAKLDITEIDTEDLRFFSDYALDYKKDAYKEISNLFGDGKFLNSITSFDQDDMKRVALMDYFYVLADGVVEDHNNTLETRAFRTYATELTQKVSHDDLLGYTDYDETMDEIAEAIWSVK